MIKNHMAKPFEPKYVADFRIVKIVGHKVQLQPTQGGPTREEHLDHIKCVLPAERYISGIPDYKQFGRKTNLRLNPDKIPDLQWELKDQLNTTNIGNPLKVSKVNVNSIAEIEENVSINSIYVNVCAYANSKIDHNSLQQCFEFDQSDHHEVNQLGVLQSKCLTGNQKGTL